MMLSIILAAFCLRIIITGVGPLLPEITANLGLTGRSSGLLTTLPLLAFAVVSPLAGKIGRRQGEGKTILIGLCLILLGTVLRSTLGVPGLFLGTAIVGIGTALGNVLLPAVVKAEYPTRVGQVTAYYTVAMVAAAAIGLALNVPLSGTGLGWNGALLVWGIAVVITGLIWRKNASLRLSTSNPTETEGREKPIWKSGLAWCVTLYFGINSMIFYAVIGWLPTILQSAGMQSGTAGIVTSLYQVVSLAPSLLVPTLAGKCRDQRGWLMLGSVLNIIGIITLMSSTAAAAQVTATIILGLANGCAFSMGLALMGFRARDAVEAARLSGFAQSVGYALAATGPMVVGWLHDLTPNWNIGLGYILFASVVALLAGQKAGRDETV
ncbi:MAG TPA: MFS transporter [Ruminococcaceae bacterium]|nr:MFS transporter [Oscillospiraceae bacterium]